MVFNLGHVVGTDGKGIQSIVKTDTTGLVDTYTITYTNGDTQTYSVTNGADGSFYIADSVTNGDTTHSPSGDAVYDFVTGLVGDIQEYVNR